MPGAKKRSKRCCVAFADGFAPPDRDEILKAPGAFPHFLANISGAAAPEVSRTLTLTPNLV